jgi:L-arabinose transport system substrate-binding protein
MPPTVRRRALTGLVFVLAAGLAACSSGQTTAAGNNSQPAAKTGPLTIAYLQKQGDQQYFVDEAAGAKAEAAKLGNVTVDAVDLGTDSNKAISALTTEVGQQVDGIAIVVPDQKIGPQVIGQAQSANIPLVASDDPIADGAGKPAPFIGFDSGQMGTSVGQEAAKLYRQAGWTPSDTKIIATYKQDLSDCQQREQGEESGFTSSGGTLPQEIKVGTDNSVVDAQNKTAAVITTNPGVRHWVVWGCNDESETGAVTALQNAGVSPDNIIGVGLGAYLTCKDWKAGTRSGNKAALFINGRDVGALAVQGLVDHLRSGKAMPARTVAPTKIVDPGNWQQSGVECT